MAGYMYFQHADAAAIGEFGIREKWGQNSA